MSFNSILVAAIGAVVFGYTGGIITGLNIETPRGPLQVIRPLSPAPKSLADYDARHKGFEARTIKRAGKSADDPEV